jgi:hypothetical protein
LGDKWRYDEPFGNPAIYVKPVTRWTGLYMAIIESFRRSVVYPSLLGHLRSAWLRSTGSAEGSNGVQP